MSFTGEPGGPPLTLTTEPVWGSPKANPREEHTVPPAHSSSPFSCALSPIPRGVFAARSSLPCTLPLVAANGMTQERHGAMPALSPACVAGSRSAAVCPCACMLACRRKHTLLAEQSWRVTASFLVPGRAHGNAALL